MKSVCNNESLMYLNTLLQNSVECHVFKPSRIEYFKNSLQVRSATLIDQICSNLIRYSCISGNLFYPDSDHFPNFLIVKDFIKNTNVSPQHKLYRRNFKNIDNEQLNNDIDNINWYTKVVTETNIDKCFENIIDETYNLLDNHAPLIEVSHRKAKYCYKPWIDPQLLTEIRVKNKFYETKKIRPNEINKEIYKAQKNRVTKLIRSKKRQYFNNYFNKYRHDTRKTWEGITLALESTKNRKTLPQVIYDTKNKPLSTPCEKANSFAEYFKNVPKNVLKKIKPSRFWYMNYFNRKTIINNYLTLHDSSPTEISKLIIQLKNRSSTGPVSIPNNFLKMIAVPLSYPLSCAINKSLRAGYFPNILKIGRQTPVFKSGICTVSNYRPITVCSSFSKILEKVVRDRLQNFVTENNIINKNQFRFRKNHSTTHATTNLLEATIDGLDNKLKVGGVFLDVSKAFDCVDHDILLKKLEFYGIREMSLMWIESYLKDRTQYVELNGTKSNEYTSNIGVPQGGVLSALLFILFTNDIIESTKKLNFSIFADDTCLTLSIERSKYDETLKAELQKVIEWFTCNRLLLNINKTEYIFFGPHYPANYIKGDYDLADLHSVVPLEYLQHPDPDYDGPDHNIVNKKGEFCLDELHKISPNYIVNEYVTSENETIIIANDRVKYLGLHIDEQLQFKYHINIVCCKINRMIGTFWKCLVINIKTKKIIYHSLVESYLNFGILIWCSELSKNLMTDQDINHIPKTLKPIKTSQNKILRAIFGKRKYDKISKTNSPSSPLYKDLQVLKIQDLYYYNLSLLAYDYYNNPGFPEILSEKFTSQSSNMCSRSHNLNLNYAVPSMKNTYRKPSIASSIMWNKLPIQIRESNTKNIFKKKLKKYFIENY